MEFNTICELVDKATTKYGRKTLYKTETKNFSYKELNALVDSYAINLNSLKGEKIGILSENRFEWEINFAEVKPENIAVICFTSGTTSKSKAVSLTHKNICANIQGVEKIYDLTMDDTCLAAMPLSHVLEGLFNMLNCINVGASRAHINGVENIADALGKYKETYISSIKILS